MAKLAHPSVTTPGGESEESDWSMWWDVLLVVGFGIVVFVAVLYLGRHYCRRKRCCYCKQLFRNGEPEQQRQNSAANPNVGDASEVNDNMDVSDNRNIETSPNSDSPPSYRRAERMPKPPVRPLFEEPDHLEPPPSYAEVQMSQMSQDQWENFALRTTLGPTPVDSVNHDNDPGTGFVNEAYLEDNCDRHPNNSRSSSSSVSVSSRTASFGEMPDVLESALRGAEVGDNVQSACNNEPSN